MQAIQLSADPPAEADQSTAVLRRRRSKPITRQGQIDMAPLARGRVEDVDACAGQGIAATNSAVAAAEIQPSTEACGAQLVPASIPIDQQDKTRQDRSGKHSV
jgi:hypothetical protein